MSKVFKITKSDIARAFEGDLDNGGFGELLEHLDTLMGDIPAGDGVDAPAVSLVLENDDEPEELETEDEPEEDEE